MSSMGGVNTDHKAVREIDTPEWGERVRRDVICHLNSGNNLWTSWPLGIEAPPGFDLDIGVKIRATTDARNDTGLARKV